MRTLQSSMPKVAQTCGTKKQACGTCRKHAGATSKRTEAKCRDAEHDGNMRKRNADMRNVTEACGSENQKGRMRRKHTETKHRHAKRHGSMRKRKTCMWKLSAWRFFSCSASWTIKSCRILSSCNQNSENLEGTVLINKKS